MQCSIDGFALREAIGTVSKALPPRRDRDPARRVWSTRVLVDAESHTDTVRVTATDLDVWVTVDVPAAVSTSGAVALPAEDITALVSSARKKAPGVVTIDATMSVPVTVGFDDQTLHLEGMPADEFPSQPNPRHDAWHRPVSVDAIRSVAVAAGDPTRPGQESVALFRTGEVVSTDNRRIHSARPARHSCGFPGLASLTRDHTAPHEEGEGPLLIPKRVAALLKSSKVTDDATQPMLSYCDDDRARIYAGVVTIDFQPVVGPWPPSIGPFLAPTNDELAVIRGDMRSMRDTIDAIHKMVRGTEAPVRFDPIDADTFTMSAQVSGVRIERTIVGTMTPPDIGPVAFNPAFLRDLFHGAPDGVELRGVDGLKPWRIRWTTSDTEHHRVLMPVKVLTRAHVQA